MIRPLRVLIGILIAASFVGVGIGLWASLMDGQTEFINVFAGSAAILAASISAVVAIRSAELTEERLKPYPYPFIDARSRYQLAQLRIKNVGGTAAHEVYLEWGEAVPKLQSEREDSDVPLLANGKTNAIAVLLPNESVAQSLGTPKDLLDQARELGKEWGGIIRFQDARGTRHQFPFRLNITNLGRELLYDSEEPRTLYELQKIPAKLEDIAKIIKQK